MEIFSDQRKALSKCLFPNFSPEDQPASSLTYISSDYQFCLSLQYPPLFFESVHRHEFLLTLFQLKSVTSLDKEFGALYSMTKIMASSPITSWKVEGEKVEAVTDFLFLDSKITTAADCSHVIKRHLLLMTNLGSIFKSRDLTLPTKVHIVNAVVFPVVMY